MSKDFMACISCDWTGDIDECTTPSSSPFDDPDCYMCPECDDYCIPTNDELSCEECEDEGCYKCTDEEWDAWDWNENDVMNERPV